MKRVVSIQEMAFQDETRYFKVKSSISEQKK